MNEEEYERDTQEENLRSAANLKSSLEKYAYQSPSSSPARSSRRPTAEVVIPHSQADYPSKRKIMEAESFLSPAKAKKKRGYAPPETYAHLNYLTDCLDMHLEGS